MVTSHYSPDTCTKIPFQSLGPRTLKDIVVGMEVSVGSLPTTQPSSMVPDAFTIHTMSLLLVE